MEANVREKHGKEASLRLRPARLDDPVPFLAKILGFLLQKMLDYILLEMKTDAEYHSIKAFNCQMVHQSESGRQIHFDGNIGLWEDNGIKVS